MKGMTYQARGNAAAVSLPESAKYANFRRSLHSDKKKNVQVKVKVNVYLCGVSS